MVTEDRLREIVQELLAEHLEAQADWRSKTPSMVLIYPLDQSYLKSGFVGQKWMLKLCCMAPGEEHTLHPEGTNEGDTHPELGWYRLEDLGQWTGPILKWAKSHEKLLTVVSLRLGAALEWVHDDAVTSFLNEQANKISDLPTSQLPPGGGEYLPISSDLVRLAGLSENEYRVLEGQGLVFLQKVFEQHQPCLNLQLFIHKGRMLWLCKKHLTQMKAQDTAIDIARGEELVRKYLENLKKRVSTVRIPGDAEPHDLKEVFVELTIANELKRPSSNTQAEFLGLLDAQLRKRRNPLTKEFGGSSTPLRVASSNPKSY